MVQQTQLMLYINYIGLLNPFSNNFLLLNILVFQTKILNKEIQMVIIPIIVLNFKLKLEFLNSLFFLIF